MTALVPCSHCHARRDDVVRVQVPLLGPRPLCRDCIRALDHLYAFTSPAPTTRDGLTPGPARDAGVGRQGPGTRGPAGGAATEVA